MSLLRSDPRLLAAFRAGERAALERVYWHYVDVVTEIARRGALFANGGQVGGAVAHDLPDLVQETFVRAFTERARLAYDGLREYRPYLATICRNLMADWARKRGREIPSELDPQTHEGESSGSAPSSPAEPEPWADEATIKLVESYVQSLEPPLLQVYDLRFARGASQAEAAAALDLGRQRIRTMEKQIRAGLAALLDGAR